ncbi:hypothetical protein FV139_01535 [Parahaliea maris]|uniref:Uncharacterized protein n=1 Tax=Parahaliea maris TaxID=2716870 RepID=A0A5C9A842_9GAMM|nr:hypothetical protein [Parahaliea maris]TXS96212.1 hypothetical protein FV139_01535 [Parahaliea maris]
MWLRLLPALFLLSSAAVQADKPHLIDCDAKDVARNAAMEAAVGVHGPCDAEKVSNRAKDDVDDKLDDARDGAEKKMDKVKDKQKDKDKKKLHKDKD